MSMNTEKALNEAIESLGQLMDDSYEGEEREDPTVKAWLKTKQDAIDALVALKRLLYSPC